MEHIELDLDDKVMWRARQLAEVRGATVEAVLTDIITQGISGGTNDRWLGMFADEPELLDEVVASTMAARERDKLRASRD